MAMTLTEKILSKASEKDSVSPGEIVEAKIDIALTHETLGPIAFQEFEKIGGKVWDPDKITVFADHLVPPANMMQGELLKVTSQFVKDQGITHFYPYEGVEHQLMAEKGFDVPGTVIVGTDSHTVTSGAFGAFATGIGSSEMASVFLTGSLWFRIPETIKFHISGKLRDGVMSKDVLLRLIQEIGPDGATYKAIEYDGPTISQMSIDGRMVLSNMSVEMGAKNGIIEPDAKTLQFLKSRVRRKFKIVRADPKANYRDVHDIEVSKLDPLIACPHTLEKQNLKSVREVESKIDQAFLGSCTGGRMEDIRMGARIIKRRKVHPDVRMIVTPASREIYLKAMKEGLLELFVKAGAIVCNPGCGPCVGYHQGILGKDQVCISSQNRNFRGRMGNPDSKIFVASPATVAASAIEGKIADPLKYV
jgi:homoaconitate hydratase family protein